MNRDLELIIQLNDLELLNKEIAHGTSAAATETSLGFPLEKRERVAHARDEIRGQLSRRVLSRFDMVFHKYGKAVAPVVNGVAYCCFEKLPINLYASKSTNTDITNCPYCGKFLYFL